MNQTMNGVGAKFTSLCNLLLGYRSRRDVVGVHRRPHAQSFDALEMMQSSSQRLYSAAREERFAAIVSATDEGMIECVVNSAMGPQFLRLCTSGLDGEAVAACLQLAFLPGMDTEGCLKAVEAALRNPAYGLSRAHVVELKQCCAEMGVGMRRHAQG